jgi:predicted Zn-dependent protease
MRHALLLVLLLSTTPAALAKDKKVRADPGKGVNFYSVEREIALGKQMAQEVERQAKLVEDPVVSEYVNRVAQNIVRNSDAIVPFTVKVIESDEVNAFALPGDFCSSTPVWC